MPERRRSRLSIAELLVMIAFAAVVLMQWRLRRETWGREEEVLLAVWLIAWTFGVFVGRMLGWTALLPASLLCAAATIAGGIYFHLPWQSQTVLAGAFVLLTLVTAPLPQGIVHFGHQLWRYATASLQRRRVAAGLLLTAGAAALAVWQAWQPPPVTVQILTGLVNLSRDEFQSLHLAAVAPRGRHVVAYEDRQLIVLSAAGGPPRKIAVPSPIVPQCSFSPDGRLLAVTVDAQPLRVVLYETSSLTEVAAIEPTERPRSHSFLSDGRLCLAFAPDFQHLRFEIWQVGKKPQKEHQWSFDSGPHAITGAYTPDGSHILVHRREAVGERLPWQVWRTSPPEMVAELAGDLNPNYVAGALPLYRHGDWFACGRECWNVATKKGYRIDSEPAGMRPAAGQFAFVELRLDAQTLAASLVPRTVTRGSTTVTTNSYSWKFLVAIRAPPPTWQEQTPFWRTRYIPEFGVRLRLWNQHEPAGIWQSKVQPYDPWRGSVSVASSADGDAIAAIDATGNVVLWRLSGRRGFPTAVPAKEFEIGEDGD